MGVLRAWDSQSLKYIDIPKFISPHAAPCGNGPYGLDLSAGGYVLHHLTSIVL